MKLAVDCLEAQTRNLHYLVYGDGPESLSEDVTGPHGVQVVGPKHQPGMEQPRNMGVRYAEKIWPEMTHAWFIDSDIVFREDAFERLLEAVSEGPEDRILAGPYDWLHPGVRHHVERGSGGVTPDGRWASFDESPPSRVYIDSLGAGLACFGGNLLWPLDEFKRVGGFWNELHMGRTEDGELGLRATCMQVPISLMAEVRGCHLYHDVDGYGASTKNQRDVPMLNTRHAWMPDAQNPIEYEPDRDGKRFTNACPNCNRGIQVTDWWTHWEQCQ